MLFGPCLFLCFYGGWEGVFSCTNKWCLHDVRIPCPRSLVKTHTLMVSTRNLQSTRCTSCVHVKPLSNGFLERTQLSYTFSDLARQPSWLILLCRFINHHLSRVAFILPNLWHDFLVCLFFIKIRQIVEHVRLVSIET